MVHVQMPRSRWTAEIEKYFLSTLRVGDDGNMSEQVVRCGGGEYRQRLLERA